MKYLYDIGTAEVNHGHHDDLTKWKGHAADFNATFRREGLAFARHQAPFNIPVDEAVPFGVKKWWDGIEAAGTAEILPVSNDARLAGRAAENDECREPTITREPISVINTEMSAQIPIVTEYAR